MRTEKEMREEYEERFCSDNMSEFISDKKDGCRAYADDILEWFISLWKEDRARISRHVGMMRQWLNEDRITEPGRMVTNADLLHWLELDQDASEKPLGRA